MHGFAEEPPVRQFSIADGLRVLPFGDEAVVFDPLSWDAHLLNPAAIAVLELLQGAPSTECDIIEFLQGALQPDEQPHAASHARRLLDDVMTLGLVYAVGPTPVAHR